MVEMDVDRILTHFNNLLSRGKVACADNFKSQRLALTRFIAGCPIDITGIKQDSRRLPQSLSLETRRKIAEGDLDAQRWALTLLVISREIMGGKPVDLQGITEPSSSVSDITDSEVRSFWLSLGKPKLPYHWLKYHWSTKAGPNGPALQGALHDLECLPDSLIESLKVFFNHDAPFYRLLSAKGSPTLSAWTDSLRVRSSTLIRKLSVKADREAKSRVFAILDYWSQTALKELHKGLFKLLRRLPGDCTFDQGRLILDFASKDNTRHKFHSFDLESATDRFPLCLQRRLLSLMTSDRVSEAWSDIMVGYPFVLGNQVVSYNCGQPMGAHSSWPMFTLSHHMIIYISARRARVPRFRDYMVLGDDVVIHNDLVAEEYRRILFSLGVNISVTKTHVSHNTFEFAKRWVHKGQEISPFPIHGLLSTARSWPNLVELLYSEVPKRGYKSILDLGPQLDRLSSVYERQRVGKSVVKRIFLYLTLPHWELPDLGNMGSRVTRLETMSAKPLVPSPDVLSQYPHLPKCSNLLEYMTLVANWEARREALKTMNRTSSSLDKLWEQLEIGTKKLEASHAPSPSLTVRDIPIVQILQDLSDPELQELGSTAFSKTTLEPVLFWTKFKEIDNLNIPKFNGILPLRARERKADSQAHLALRVAHFLTRTDPVSYLGQIHQEYAPRVRRRRS
jgi:hypothetical protein